VCAVLAAVVCAVLAAAVCAVLGPTTGAHAAAGPASTAERTDPKWIHRIEQVVGDRPMSIVVGQDGDFWFRHLAWVKRPPASNEKLLLSMALLRRFPPTRTIRTQAVRGRKVVHGVLDGNLWLVGHGDPETDGHDLDALAREIKATGLRRVTGSVIGATTPFVRDWWATGWRKYFPDYYIARPTALTYLGNARAWGPNPPDPERRAAAALTKRLENKGIEVHGAPSLGPGPRGGKTVAEIHSAPLGGIVRRMDFDSRNFWAEVLGKYLGAAVSRRGSIRSAARAICGFEAQHGVHGRCYDSSGLSYANRQSALGIVHLLWFADTKAWGQTLRSSLPGGGQGTLEDRLTGIRLRAKTGTLKKVSALSGWVWLQRSDQWAEFSILSSHMNEYVAKGIENKIVTVVSQNAGDPRP
jgi:D-alanyl-D-alanine carboxypeptidase/D-alanyl-D-alanine-endopeptidase (penicillin-binding protein 4)